MLSASVMKHLAGGASIFAASAIVFIQPAEAASVGGVSGIGFASYDETNQVLSFDGFTFAQGEGAANFLTGLTQLSSLAFTEISAPTFSYTTRNPFITFLNSGVTFELDIPGTATIEDSNNDGIFSIDLENVSGTFRNAGGAWLGTGVLNASTDDSGSFSYDLNVERIPEPMTLLGTAAAVAMGAVLKQRRDRQKQEA